jgi:hypothetical protein
VIRERLRGDALITNARGVDASTSCAHRAAHCRPSGDPAAVTRILLARDALTSSARTGLAHAAAGGALVRVVRGAYVDAGEWAALDADERYRVTVRSAVATASGRIVLCRAAAAALHRLPWLGRWPRHVDVVVPPDSASRSGKVLRRHREDQGQVHVVDGIAVTTLARTAIDVAREGDFARAVVVADAAAARGAVLEAELDRVPLRHGSARARLVAEFADGRSGSPGESVSRATMHLLRVPAPELQHRFPREGGGTWPVDFWWPEFDVIGEFDGDVKYLDPAMRGGRTAEQVVLDEKRREDELRRQVRAFVRWDWSVARSPALLARRLASVGVRATRPRTVL